MTGKPGIVYLLTHPRLAARLVVSLYSLRKHYSGPVSVFTTRKSSHKIGRLLAADARLRVEHRRCKEYGERGTYRAAYRTKTSLPLRFPYETTIFFDADTLIVNPLDELIEAARSNGLVVTGFGGGATNQDPVRSRLEVWRSVQKRKSVSDYQLKSRIDELTRNPYPAINLGVYAMQRCMTAKFSKRWEKLARVGQKNPLCDEIALQLMLFETPHCLLGHHFNCHPSTYRSEIGVHIWHFAGLTHLLDHCRQIWLPVFEECMKRNIAEIESWLDVELEIRSRSENASAVTRVS